MQNNQFKMETNNIIGIEFSKFLYQNTTKS